MCLGPEIYFESQLMGCLLIPVSIFINVPVPMFTRRYEIRQAVGKKSKGVLVCHTSIQVVLYVLLAIGMIVACAFDWQSNVTPNLDAGFAACNTYVNYTNCAGFNNSCTACADGFYGPDCAPCPGLVDRSDDATSDFVGVACNGRYFRDNPGCATSCTGLTFFYFCAL